MSNDEWGTPDHIFKPLNEIFNFDCDLAASNKNHKCRKYFSATRSAMLNTMAWGRINWCNPPYSRGNTMPFIDAAIERANYGIRTVMLPKCDPSTEAFKATWGQGGHYFFYNRIKFVGADSCAPFPSCLVFFGKLTASEIRALEEWGMGKYTTE